MQTFTLIIWILTGIVNLTSPKIHKVSYAIAWLFAFLFLLTCPKQYV